MALAVVLVGIAFNGRTIHGTVGADFKIERTYTMKRIGVHCHEVWKSSQKFRNSYTRIHLH